MFPEFSEVSDEMIQLKLDEGMLWVDTFWYPIDAKFAVMYAAAHYLWMQDQAAGGSISEGDSGGSGGGGGFVDPEIGKIFDEDGSFPRPASDLRARRCDYQKQQSSGGGKTASADEFWESTPYGQMYLSYRRRNVAHVAVI